MSECASKMYILVKDNIDLGHAMLACAHGTLIASFKFDQTDEWKEWKENSFRKVVCKVTEKEFEKAKTYDDFIIVTESHFDHAETGLVFKPRKEWPKFFNFLKMYK